MNIDYYITSSDVIEYLFCPAFTYFMHVLNIEQNEKRRFLVTKGIDIHEKNLVRNKDYLRKKAGAVKKESDLYLTSDKLKIVGRLDELLFLEDGTVAPLDYKYAYWDNKLYRTYKMQQTLYALLAEEHFNSMSNKAFIVYVRSKKKLVDFDVTPTLKMEAISIVHDILDIISNSKFPQINSSSMKCSDCTYRNICIK